MPKLPAPLDLVLAPQNDLPKNSFIFKLDDSKQCEFGCKLDHISAHTIIDATLVLYNWEEHLV